MQLLNKYFFSRKWDFIAFSSFIPLYGLYFILKLSGFQFPEKMPFEFFVLGWTLVDGSHVYSTLFVTYFDKGVFKNLRFRLIAVPIAIFALAAGSMFFGFRTAFLHFLAYLAAVHFIRQEFGWMKIASRFDPDLPTWISYLDKFTAYVMTIAPLMWFLRDTGGGFWYQSGDMYLFPESVAGFALSMFWPTVIAFLCSNAYHSIKTGKVNLSKLFVFTNTFFGWYVAKTLIGNPFLALWLMIFHHGMPYYFIVFKTERISSKIPVVKSLGWAKYPALYLACAVFFYYFLMSHCCTEPIAGLKNGGGMIGALLYGIAVTPQMTHFVVDAFIWKRKQKLVNVVG